MQATVTISLHNAAPATGMPDYVIGNTVGLPSGSNEMTVSVYSPLTPERAAVDGVPVGLGPQTERGWNVASLRVIVPAGHTTTVLLVFQGQLQLAHGYHLRVSPQPAATATPFSVTVTGAEKWKDRTGRTICIPRPKGCHRWPRHQRAGPVQRSRRAGALTGSSSSKGALGDRLC